MIGCLALNLKMYDPAANHEITFGDMTRSLRFGNSQQPRNTEDKRAPSDRVMGRNLASHEVLLVRNASGLGGKLVHACLEGHAGQPIAERKTEMI
jgi:hypothetical protein